MRAVFENKNICLELIGPFLTSKELGRLLCTCKKLYSFSPAYFTTIRDCWWKFGDPRQERARKRWIEYCVKRNDIQALQYVCKEQVIQRAHKYDLIDAATAVCGSIVKNAAKFGSRDTLDWSIETYLEFKKDGKIITPLDHILDVAILAAIAEGNDDRALDLIGRFSDVVFPAKGIWRVYPFPVKLYESVLCYGSCESLYKIAKSKFARYEEDIGKCNLGTVLSQGTSTRYLPFLLEQQENVEAMECLEWALENPDSRMFEFVMRHFPLSELEQCFGAYKAGYLECRNELKEAISVLQNEPTPVISLCEAIARIQSRIQLMERYYYRFFERKWPRLIPQEESVNYERWIKKQKLY